MRSQLIILVLVGFSGIGLGWLGFLLFGDFIGNSKVLYLSKKELLNLEKNRIERENKNNSNEDNKKNSIFFGRTNEAIRLMEKIAGSYQSKNNRVIFVNDEGIKGSGVISISREIHEKILEKLGANYHEKIN